MTYNVNQQSTINWYTTLKSKSIHFGPIDYLALDKLWNGPYIELEVLTNKLIVKIVGSNNPLDWVGIFNKDEEKFYNALLWHYTDNKDEIEFYIKDFIIEYKL